jgi:acetyltransferase-like isoleucine patch superfamily enzyme
MEIIRRYGFLGTIRLLWDLVKTKLLLSSARLIRFPFDIRNKKYIKIGKDFTTGRYCRLEAHPQSENQQICLTIGDRVQINDSVHIVASEQVVIGHDVLIASKVFISDLNHGSYGKDDIHHSPFTLPVDRPLSSKPVIIEDRVWLGEFVCVLPGVTIGAGSIIGSMSVVTKNIPPNCIAVGSPAKVIKKFNFESNIWEIV